MVVAVQAEKPEGLAGRAALALAYVVAMGWMLTSPEQHHRWQFLAASLVLARVGGPTLLWIARPAAHEPSPQLTTTQALLELIAGGLVISTTGAHSLLLGAALILVVRTTMRYSYQTWGGIQKASVSFVRWILAIAVPLIARLPESSLTSGAH